MRLLVIFWIIVCILTACSSVEHASELRSGLTIMGCNEEYTYISAPPVGNETGGRVQKIRNPKCTYVDLFRSDAISIETNPTKNCGNVSPAHYYVNILHKDSDLLVLSRQDLYPPEIYKFEREWLVPIPFFPNTADWPNPRQNQVLPASLKDQYSQKTLECWAQKGDQIASALSPYWINDRRGFNQETPDKDRFMALESYLISAIYPRPKRIDPDCIAGGELASACFLYPYKTGTPEAYLYLQRFRVEDCYRGSRSDESCTLQHAYLGEAVESGHGPAWYVYHQVDPPGMY